jgi:glucose dehydrogenase
MQANKNGFYYVIDRMNGSFISAQPFAQVNWAKGIDPETGRPIINPEAHYDHNNEAVAISPSNGGAHNWSPMSFNPTTGLVYIPTTPSSSRTFLVEANFTFQEGRMNTGVPRGGRGGAAAENPRVPSSIGPASVEGQRGGVLLAWDPITQKERWRTPGGGGAGGGTLTTAGNLVIQVINDGRLLAYTADKGEKLFDIQTGLRGGMGPPITYSLDGKQYIALMGGSGQPVRPKLLAFVLDGKEPLPQ